MNIHKYRPGQRVTFVGPAHMRGAANEYEIVALLPVEAGQLLYRVKSRTEPHERVLGEDHMADPRVQQVAGT
jgi:hypothetical protein